MTDRKIGVTSFVRFPIVIKTFNNGSNPYEQFNPTITLEIAKIDQDMFIHNI